MFGKIVGEVVVKESVSCKTLYPFGPLSDLAGKRLKVLERNRDGDCLCLVDNCIADVSANDIEAFYRAG
jgi:hypothetical protein